MIDARFDASLSAPASLLLVAIVTSGLQPSCSMQDCSGYAYLQSFPLPTAVDSFDCSLTLLGPTGNVLTCNLPVPEGYGSSCAAPTPGGYALPFSRQVASGGYPQTVNGDAPPPDVLAAFEQAVGGTTFEVSLVCGGIWVLDHDPQAVGHVCEE